MTPHLDKRYVAATSDRTTATEDALVRPIDNRGGRREFDLDERVRVFDLGGTVLDRVYLVKDRISDRKGYVTLHDEESGKKIIVSQRRILPLDSVNKAIVVQDGDRHEAVCPKCAAVALIDNSTETIKCAGCGAELDLLWLGVRPMSTDTLPPPTAPTKPVAPPKPVRPPKGEPAAVDFASLRSLGEVWTKNVNFDHPKVAARAHVFLFLTEGGGARKMCFNTYNNTMGKRQSGLPVADVCSGTTTAAKQPWSEVADVAKLREKLKREGYVHEE